MQKLIKNVLRLLIVSSVLMTSSCVSVPKHNFKGLVLVKDVEVNGSLQNQCFEFGTTISRKGLNLTQKSKLVDVDKCEKALIRHSVLEYKKLINYLDVIFKKIPKAKFFNRKDKHVSTLNMSDQFNIYIDQILHDIPELGGEDEIN